MKSVFCDVNIFQDVLSGRSGFEASLLFLELVRRRRINGYLSSLSIPILWFLNQRTDLPREKIKKIIQGFKIVPLTAAIVSQVLSNEPAGDLEDEIQHLCAQKGGCSYLVTRNTKDFPAGPIAVMAPEKFLEIV